MKVKIKGITGTVLNMEALTVGAGGCGCCDVKIVGYCITITESPGKEITFRSIAPREIEYVGE